MTFAWTGWEDDPAADPSSGRPHSVYNDWLWETVWKNEPEWHGLRMADLPWSPAAGGIVGETTRPTPMPPFALPPEGDTVAEDPLIRLTWMPDADCAVVGVIDSAIALSHARFRRLDGGTRFLSAWLMNGKWRDEAAVPFGRELFRTEIDQLMFRSMAAGSLDEGDFDRQSGASYWGATRGERMLETNATHGTFVTDLAAGYDLRQSQEDDFRRRLPIIAVGLPPNISMGAAGENLEFFASHGIEYIIDRADRIWRACDLPEDTAFPIVINLSYGLLSGPKDGHFLLEEVIRAANAAGEKKGRPVRVILPAGNDLQSEGCAKFTLEAHGSDWIDWEIKPEDHTPNYAELWSGAVGGSSASDPEHPISLSVKPPSGPASQAAPGRAGQRNTLMRNGEPVARIYCRAHERQGRNRIAYTVCTLPTLMEDRSPGAPAGLWRWEVSADKAADGYAYVQSDQSLTHGSETGLVANFAHPDYRRYDEKGFYIDVASYEPTPVDTDDTPPMRRRGTLNTVATLSEARVIGSYRGSDGKPSIFSSAADPDALPDGRKQPTCLLPGQDGLARFGLLAAGSKSGSAALMSGTSFSTALATRAVSQAMLGWIDGGRSGTAPGDESWFQSRVSADEASAGWPGGTVPEKAGYGRMTAPSTGRIRRA